MNHLSAAEAVAAMRSGLFTAEEYAQALLAQCERWQALNAFITLDGQQVLADARAADEKRASGQPLGPLHGLPIPIKDSINTRDYPTTCGTSALRSFRPREDAAIVKTLRDAGAIVLGKTNLLELSLGWTSNNQAFGPVRNPYDPARIPGGSSGGSAAAVAAGMAPLSVAEDTEGSIRVPAALCGIAGFRPTTLRYPSNGTAPITPLFDQVGPHARTVSDLVLFDSVVSEDFEPIRPAALAGLKLGVPRQYFFAGLDPELEQLINAALRKLEDAGVVLIEGEIDELADLIARTTVPIQNHDILHALPRYLQTFGAGVTFDELVNRASTEVQAFFADIRPGGKAFVAEQAYHAARETHLPKLRSNFNAYFAATGVTAIAFPATMTPATLIGQEDEQDEWFVKAVSRNIAPGSTAGLPGLVLSAGMTRAGLPVALEFDGPAGSDRALLALGLSAESVLGRLPAPKGPDHLTIASV